MLIATFRARLDEYSNPYVILIADTAAGWTEYSRFHFHCVFAWNIISDKKMKSFTDSLWFSLNALVFLMETLQHFEVILQIAISVSGVS